MRLEANVTRTDLRDVVAQFSPLEVTLGEGGKFVIACVTALDLLPGKGVLLVADGTVHWPVLGIDVPVRLRGMRVLLVPSIRADGLARKAILALAIRIERAGVSVLPGPLDERVTSLLNQELAKRTNALAWNFAKTLSYALALPPSVATSSSFDLAVERGNFVVTEDALLFTIDFSGRVEPRAFAAHAVEGDAAPPSEPAETPA